MRFHRSLVLLPLLFFLCHSTGAAQGAGAGASGASGGGVRITARILDDTGGEPIEYANVVLHRVADSSMVMGTVSDREGRIVLDGVPEGRYYLAIHFIGYEDVYRNSIVVGGTDRVDLGDMHMTVTAIEMDAVEVDANRAPVEYQIDKKVINVDGQLTAASGTAVEALQNVPSVTVDLDGTVRLRGSGSFTVLIDGQPSPLESSDALRQIPSSAIQNIEIITNPSARYDPDGVAGIINVIMKKDGRRGTSGQINLSTGMYDNYRGDFLFTLRDPSYTVYFGADYGKNNRPGIEREERRFISPGSTLVNAADGSNRRQHRSYGLRGGIELPLTDRDNLNLGLRYGDHSGMHGSTRDYEEYTLPETSRFSYLSMGASERGGTFLGLDLDYRHRFTRPRHELTMQIAYRQRDGKETSSDELLDAGHRLTSGRRATEDGPGNHLRARLDYVLPLGEKSRLETGYQAAVNLSEDITSLAEYDSTSGAYTLLPQFGHSSEYFRNVQALYSMYAMEIGDWGLQAGLRGEFTDRHVTLQDSAAEFEINRWDLFPSLHASYSLSATQQIMASYTRRIERPRGWFLEPFLTWMDAFTVRRGNPGLEPEYIDALELAYQTHIGSALASAEIYRRTTHNTVEFVRSVYRDNVSLQTVENVGQEFSTGVELMFNARIAKIWDIYLLGNLYDYRIEGALRGESFAEQRFTWNMRFNNTFSITPTTTLQANTSYNSPSVSAQGRTEGYAVVGLALRQEFLDRSLSAILDVSDLLHSGDRESTFAGPDFSSWNYSLADGPVVTLTLRYTLSNGQGDPQKKQRERDDFGTEEF